MEHREVPYTGVLERPGQKSFRFII